LTPAFAEWESSSGYGLGICHQLLRNLSLPPGTPLPASTLQPLALAPSQKHLLDEIETSEPDKEIPLDDSTTLTLILACRSPTTAAAAKEAIMKRHGEEMAKREKQGLPVRKGWREGLRVVVEQVDLDAVGGKRGVLAFCERLKETYAIWRSKGLIMADIPMLRVSISMRGWERISATTISSL